MPTVCQLWLGFRKVIMPGKPQRAVLWKLRHCRACRIPPDWRPHKPKSQDPVAPLNATTGTQETRLYYLLDPDSRVSGDDTIGPWCLMSVYTRFSLPSKGTQFLVQKPLIKNGNKFNFYWTWGRLVQFIYLDRWETKSDLILRKHKKPKRLTFIRICPTLWMFLRNLYKVL